MGQALVVLDTSVLINFLLIDRMDLLKRYDHEFVVTDHVSAEITDYYTTQRLRLIKSISDGILIQETIHRVEEMSIFSTLTALETLGSGECSAIALAVCRGCTLAIDDRRAANQARKISQDIRILRTQDMLASMVTQELLSSREAAAIRETWARKHRFIIRDSGDGLNRILNTKEHFGLYEGRL